ncbi:MAG: DUF2249 domain-containing protein [bacterium]
MTDIVQTLDVRPIVPREKHSTIFKLFDSLAVGQAFQLVNDHDPMPLFYQFQMDRPGAFNWEKVESGPEVWRITISKEAAPKA